MSGLRLKGVPVSLRSDWEPLMGPPTGLVPPGGPVGPAGSGPPGGFTTGAAVAVREEGDANTSGGLGFASGGEGTAGAVGPLTAWAGAAF